MSDDGGEVNNQLTIRIATSRSVAMMCYSNQEVDIR